jgi:hypothetical protein
MRRLNREGRNESPDSHVTDTVLMLAADGELDSDEAARVRLHLEACWSCRVRMEKIESAIADVVDYRNTLVASHLPLSSGPRALFIARLEELAAGSRRAALLEQLLARTTAWAAPLNSRRLWGPALASLLAVAVLMRISRTPTVSATELLERAQASNERVLQSVRRPVVYRKIRIQSRERDVTTVLYHDTTSARTVHTYESETATADLEERLQAARLSWNDPLSLSAFISWRDVLPERTETVTRSRDGLLTLHTSTDQGPITAIDLTLRDADYHPVAELLHFQDEDNVQISELAYSVMPFDGVDASIFAPPLLPHAPTVAAAPISTPVLASAPSVRELADAELEARLALHATGADLGEQIEVANTNGKIVVVTGLLGSAEREQELLRALEGIPHLHAQLDTVEHADMTISSLDAKDSKPIIAVASAPPLEPQLEAHLSDPVGRAEFINVSLNQARSALSTVWALRRLSERYSGDVISDLSVTSQHALEALIRDHVEALQKDLGDLSTGLLPLLSESVEAARNCEPDPDSPLRPCVNHGCACATGSSSTAGNPDTDMTDWHRGVDVAFSDAQRIHTDVSVLLAGAGNQDVDTAGVVRDLKVVLDRTVRQLPSLGQHVSGNFLSTTAVNASSR